MKPADLLDPAKLPEELQWVAKQHKLHPDDPVFLLIAWHWNRINKCEETVRNATVEMRAILDARTAKMGDAAEVVTGVNSALAEVQDALERKPEELAAQLQAALKQPLAGAIDRLKALEAGLVPLARKFEDAQRRQLLAGFLIGVALGAIAAVILFFA